MSQVIMLFLFPIGVYFYFFVERKNRPLYQKVFDDFQQQMDDDTIHTNEEKMKLFEAMLHRNGYTIVDATRTSIVGQKRIFLMSLLAMGIGAYFVGAAIYLIYFFFIQKPHRVEFKV